MGGGAEKSSGRASGGVWSKQAGREQRVDSCSARPPTHTMTRGTLSYRQGGAFHHAAAKKRGFWGRNHSWRARPTARDAPRPSPRRCVFLLLSRPLARSREQCERVSALRGDVSDQGLLPPGTLRGGRAMAKASRSRQTEARRGHRRWVPAWPTKQDTPAGRQCAWGGQTDGIRAWDRQTAFARGTDRRHSGPGRLRCDTLTFCWFRL